MKKTLLALSTAVMMTAGAAQAEPAQALLEWSGWVGGTFNSADIALTGQGGGEIQKGLLNIKDDGTFSTARAIIVEAHATEDDGNGNMVAAPELYDGDVDWDYTAPSIDHINGAYDVSNVKILMDGVEMVMETPVTTPNGDHIVGFEAEYSEEAAVLPGERVTVAATILAEPSVGGIVTPPAL